MAECRLIRCLYLHWENIAFRLSHTGSKELGDDTLSGTISEATAVELKKGRWTGSHNPILLYSYLARF